MISLNANLEIAKRAMQTHQLAMSVLGTNIANVNTPGYSRRRAAIRECREVDTGTGFVGAGAEVVDIRRVRDSLLDSLYRRHQSRVGEWSGVEDYLGKVETLMNEPGAGGLSETMGEFWAAWEDLANEPESQAVRSQLRLRAEALCETFHRLESHLRGLQANISGEVASLVDNVNRLGERLAEVNRMVQEGEVGGHEASGLRDERDRLLDELSDIANVEVEEATDGSLVIMLGSQVLVQGGTSRGIEYATDPGGRSSSCRFVWEGTDHEVQVESGLLRGYLRVRDEHIEGYIANLDQLAATIVSQVNAAHSAGYGLDGSTGLDFFDPDRVTAADIGVDAAIQSSLDAIAASAGSLQGDGQNALAVAGLRSVMTMAGASTTFDGYYGSLVGQIGIDSRESSSFREAEEVLVLDIESQRMATSGVSLDEEMAYLISYQHAYEAMVRVTQIVDEMMATLIGAMG